MKRDIDALLTERGISAALILKSETPNPTFRYLVGDPHITVGMLFWRPGKRPHLVHSSMERDGAESTGYELSDYGSLGWQKILETEETRARANARLIAHVLDRLQIRGRILIHGVQEIGRYYHIQRHLLSMKPDLELAEDEELGLFDRARLTKDLDEVEAIRSVGRACADAYRRVRETIQGGRLEGKRLRDTAGWVTVGRLRREIRSVFFQAGLEEPEGNIVAMGRDAGVPHNVGNDDDVLEEGAPIVIDLFPAQPFGGYYFDATRTYCVGRASDELKAIHSLVKEAVDRTMDTLAAETPARMYQEKVCDLFESRGHRTIRQDEKILEGYVHGLGHGIGLQVHERPNLGGTPKNMDRITPGSLFTVEPGLYYPSRGIGLRIEDVIYARPDGSFENITDIPYDLEIAPASA